MACDRSCCETTIPDRRVGGRADARQPAAMQDQAPQQRGQDFDRFPTVVPMICAGWILVRGWCIGCLSTRVGWILLSRLVSGVSSNANMVTVYQRPSSGMANGCRRGGAVCSASQSNCSSGWLCWPMATMASHSSWLGCSALHMHQLLLHFGQQDLIRQSRVIAFRSYHHLYALDQLTPDIILHTDAPPQSEPAEW